MSIIDQVRLYAKKGWGTSEVLVSSKHDKTFTALICQKGAYICALTYIADEATVDDFDTIKELAHIALGREWNRDGSPVESKEGD